MLGHVLLTSTVDLLLLALLVARGAPGRPRARPRWWLAAGLVAGLATYNRLLVVVVGFGLLLGIAVLGPRASFRSATAWGGAVIAVVVGLPNLLYQATHGWPQLAMGAALSDNNAAEVRSQLPVLLLVMLGPPLVAVWGTGLVWLLRRERRRAVGSWPWGPWWSSSVTLACGAQPHYPITSSRCCMPRGDPRRPLGRSRRALRSWPWDCSPSTPPCPWRSPSPCSPSRPSDDARCRLGPADRGPGRLARLRGADPGGLRRPPRCVRPEVVTSNYGEAGAVPGSPRAGTAPPVSGHNGLPDGPPPAGAARGRVRGLAARRGAGQFAYCEIVDRLDNGLDVDNEEQGPPVAICTTAPAVGLAWPSLPPPRLTPSGRVVPPSSRLAPCG